MKKLYQGELVKEVGRLPGSVVDGWRTTEVVGAVGLLFAVALLAFAAYDAIAWWLR